MMTVKKEFRHTLIDWTFEDKCIDELQYNLYIQQKIERGINLQGRRVPVSFADLSDSDPQVH